MPKQFEALSVGSLVIDVINGQKTVGGASANAAVDLRMLGTKSSVLTAISDEPEAIDYQTYLNSLGVHIYGLQNKLAQLPRCVIEMGSDGKEIGYDWQANGVEDLFQVSEVDAQLVTRFPLIYLAICEHIFAGKIARTVNLDQILAYNPGSRVLEDHDLFKQVQQRANYIFLNEAEYGHLVSKGFVQVPGDLIIKPDQVAVITAGKRETLLVSATDTIKVQPEQVLTVDETGAGDSFASAFLWARMSGYPFESCVRMGNLLASFVVQQIGCQIDTNTADKFMSEAQKRGLL